MQTDAHKQQQPDVLIIGGGPAGTTVGALLAHRGHSVCLLEKTEHPRFHIGESLLPMNLPILQRLGVLAEVEAIGVKKMGADFTYGESAEDYRTYRFERALGASPPHAFEVKREQFDQLLFENCRKAGVQTYQQHSVEQVAFGGQRSHVTSVAADGTQYNWQPRFVIDASGREAFLGARNGWRKKNSQHASAAIFGHFSNVTRRPGDDAGNISVYWFPHGWIWMIPLRDGNMSIGAVCWPDYLRTRNNSVEEFLEQTLQLCPATQSRMQMAKLESPVRVAGNYSYRSNRLFGNGYLLVGDAYAFIDPVFSSGVYLGMHSAEQAVPVIEHWLAERRALYQRAARAYQRRIDRGLANFSWFIYRFTSPAMRNLFHNPRNIWQVEQAVISMLAGDVFDNRQVMRKLKLFKTIYAISWVLALKASVQARRRRSINSRLHYSES